ncbi:MAG: CoA transferase, partial [Pseudomonadota bacterium]
ARQSNLLDGGAPFYRCYTCACGGHVAVGALEPQFFAAMMAGLGLADEGWVQGDRTCWPALTARLGEVFASQTRDHWAAHFAKTDACVTPVLSMWEADSHPHNAARGTFAGAPTQPAAGPRFHASVKIDTDSA